MSDTKVAIKDLYKIFGSNPSSMIDKVKDGISKSDLLEKYGHVLYAHYDVYDTVATVTGDGAVRKLPGSRNDNHEDFGVHTN